MADAPLLLRNQAAKGNNWLGLKLEGVHCNRDASGRKFTGLRAAKGATASRTTAGAIFRHTIRARCWASGPPPKLNALEIHWPAPSKQIEKLTNLPINRYVRIVEGKGIVT